MGGLTFSVNREVSIVESRVQSVSTVLQYAVFGQGPLTILGMSFFLHFINLNLKLILNFSQVALKDWHL